LEELSRDARVTVRREAPPDAEGKCVVYWMQRAQRALDNLALDVAIEAANALRKPLVVFLGLVPFHPNANLRHYQGVVNHGPRGIQVYFGDSGNLGSLPKVMFPKASRETNRPVLPRRAYCITNSFPKRSAIGCFGVQRGSASRDPVKSNIPSDALPPGLVFRLARSTVLVVCA